MILSAFVVSLLLLTPDGGAQTVPSPDALAAGRSLWTEAVRARQCEEALLLRGRVAWLKSLTRSRETYDLLDAAALNAPVAQAVFDGRHFAVPGHQPVLLTGPDHAGKTSLILGLETYLRNDGREAWSYAIDRTRALPRVDAFHQATLKDVATRAVRRPNVFTLIDYEADVLPHTPYHTLAFLDELAALNARYGIKLVVTLSDAEFEAMRQTLSDRAFTKITHGYLRLDLAKLGRVPVPDALARLFPGRDWEEIERLLK